MKSRLKKKDRALGERGQVARSRRLPVREKPDKQQPESSLLASPEQAVKRLQSVLADIDKLPLLVGEAGCLLLDGLELTDKIRERVRSKAKEVLAKEPGLIDNWSVSNGSPVRELSRDSAAVFKALADADEDVTIERFLQTCCTPTLGGIENCCIGSTRI
jgi:hypothetical protein